MGNMENSVKPHENKMGTMPMTRLILTMSLPAIFSMTIQAMYNVVDSIFIGNYDADGLTATSLAYPLQMLLIAFAAGTAVGVNSFVSRKLGEKNFVQANDGATHGFVTCIFNYVIFLLLGLFAVRPFMAMYTQNEAIVNYGIQYLTVVLCFSFFSIVQIMVEKTLQATGNMIFPMLSQLFGAIVNIIFDPLLIFGIGIFPEMGVLGAAIATVFGQFCGMVFCLCILFFKNNEVKVSFKHFKLNGSTLKSIYVVGFPSVIMQSIGSVMIIGLNAILAVSEAAVTVLGIYYKLQSFVFMPCFGLNQGVMPIIGYNYGARKKKRMYSALKARHHHWRNYYGGRHNSYVDNPRTAYCYVWWHTGYYGYRCPCIQNHKPLLYSCCCRHYLYNTFSGGRKGTAQSYYVILPSACTHSSDCVGAFYGV